MPAVQRTHSLGCTLVYSALLSGCADSVSGSGCRWRGAGLDLTLEAQLTLPLTTEDTGRAGDRAAYETLLLT